MLKRIWASLIGLFKSKPKQTETEPTEKEQDKADIWQPARELHALLKRGWDSAAKFGHIDLVEVGSDNFGNLYFVPANILSIPVERLQAIDTVKLGVFHGIDEPYMTAFNKLLLEHSTKGNLEEVRQLVADFERRKEKLPQQETLLTLACLFLFRHDENPYNYSPTMIQQKVSDAKKDPELRAFFLQMGLEIVMQSEAKPAAWTKISEPDFINYSAGTTKTRESSPTITK